MADNLFDRSYSGSSSAPRDTKAKIEQIAVQSGVPVNVLLAFGETSGAQNEDDMVRLATEAAGFISADMAKGKTIEQVVQSFTADEAVTAQFLNRAREIGMQLYPDQMAQPQDAQPVQAGAQDGGLGIKDAALSFGAGVTDFGAGAVRAGGKAVEMAAETVNQYVNNAGTILGADGPIVPPDAPNPLEGVAGAMNDFAQDTLRGNVSQQGQAAIRGATPQGNLFDPSTWSMGDDPTLRGYALLGTDLLGSMAPVVIATIMSGGTAAAAMGGAGSAGQAMKDATDQIDTMANEVMPDGRYRIETESTAYQRYRAAGMDHNAAVARIKDEAERLAFAAAGFVGTVGGKLTGEIVEGTVGRMAGGGVLRRALVSGAGGALEEGAQEVLEGVSARGAVNLAAGTDQNVMDGSLPEFVLGAMGGGVVGGVAGAAARPEEAAQPRPEAPREAAQPAAPETAPTAPGLADMQAPETQPAPRGELGEAASQAPGPLFQGMQRGEMVTITPNGGDPIAATFEGETPLAATFISEDGEVMEIPRGELESGAVQIGGPRVKPTIQEGKKPDEPLIQEADPLEPPPTVEAPEAPPAEDTRAELSPPAAAAMDYLQERWAMIRADNELSDEEASRRAAELTKAYIMRLPEAERWDDDVVALLEDLNARLGDAPAPAAAPAAPITAEEPAPAAPEAPAQLPGTDIAENNAPEEPPQGQPAAAPVAAPRMDRETWDAMNETEREDAVRRAGYVTPKGNISGPGQKIMSTPWDKLPAGARTNLGGAVDGETGVRQPEAPQVPENTAETTADAETVEQPRDTADTETEQNTTAPEAPPAEAQVEAQEPQAEAEPAPTAQPEAPAPMEGLSPEENAELAALEGEFKAKMEPAEAPAPEADPAPVEQPTAEAEPAPQTEPEAPAQPAPSGVDYPNRLLGMRKAKADPVVDGIGDNSDMSLGSVALANARPGDVLPGVGTVEKVTDKQLQVKLQNGNVARLSAGSEKLDRIARDMGALIAGSANMRPESLGSLMDMIERDPALTYQNDVPVLIDDPELRGERPARRQRDTILRPLTAPTTEEQGGGEVGEGGGEVGADPAPETPPTTEAQPEEAPATEEASQIDAAAAEADPNPTPAQAEAGNYKKGHTSWNGLNLTIETAKGEERRGTAPDGTEWSVTMPAHYGYIKRTEGADGEQVDFYMGGMPGSDFVLIVNQIDPETRAFDEHKVILGAGSAASALSLYESGFSDGKGKARIGSYTQTNVANFKAWLAEGDLSKPTEPIKGGKAGPKLQSFGNYVDGARRDKAKSSILSLRDDRDTESMGINEAFPEPDYEALVDAGVPQDAVAYVAMLRNTVPRKPTRGKWGELQRWVRETDARRMTAADLLEGKITVEEAVEKTRAFDDVTIGTRAMAELLAQDVPARLFKAAFQNFGAHPNSTRYQYEDRGGKQVMVGTKKVFGLRTPEDSQYSSGTPFETLEDARPFLLERLLKWEKEQAEKAPETRNRKPVELGVYSDQGLTYMIGFVVKTDAVKVMGGFATRDEAWDYIRANQEQVQEDAEKLRDGPAERRSTNRPRSGPAHRDGDATEQMWKDAFGFNFVDFGDWLDGPERQTRFNEAYDALMDLAGALNIPTQALSLNGTLSLAFGSRGRGGKNAPAAHYEIGRTIINLTKVSGAGALAHEWFHALDNWLARQDAKDSTVSAAITGKGAKRRTEYMSDRSRDRGSLPNVYSKARALRGKLRHEDSSWFKRSQNLDKARSEPYFATTVELAARGFEFMVTDDLRARGMTNDFLANINEAGGAYPTTAEARRFGIRQAFMDLMNEVRPLLEVEGGTRVELPPVDAALLDDGPQAGAAWEGFEVKRRITERNGDEVVIESTKADGTVATNTVSLSLAEKLMDQDAFDISPEGEAQRRATQIAKEKDEERRVADEALKAKAESALTQFLASPAGRTFTKGDIDELRERTSMNRSNGTRAGFRSKLEHVVSLIDDEGWIVKGEGRSRNLQSPFGSYYKTLFKKPSILNFAAWYVARQDQEAIDRLKAMNAAQGLPTEVPPLELDEEDREDMDADPPPALPPLPEPEAQPDPSPAPAPEPAPQPAPEQKREVGGLKGLTDAENALLADLEAQFLNKITNQINSGLDPELVAIAARIAGLYVKAGTRRFRALIDTMINRLGLTLEQAQPYARGAYNQIRGDMELAGEDISDMDSDAEVIAEIRKMRKEAEKASQAAPESGNVTQQPTEGAGNDAGGADQQSDGGVDSGAPASGGSVEAGGAAEGSGGAGEDGAGGGAGDRPARPGASNLGGNGPAVERPAADSDAAAESNGVTPRTGENPGNFQITDEFGLGSGTDGQKIKANLEAIRLVKQLDRENRYATKEEQAVLARYVGWGGLKTVFDPKKSEASDQWGRAQRELKELLAPSEYTDAFQSVSNAHYTAKPVVDAMWRAMQHFGFTGGRALEPTVGVGNFLGAQPAELAQNTQWYASELDTITSRIAHHLYPDATVLTTGFQKANFRENSFDIAIGNPPFGGETITDRNPARKHLSGMKIHNYIIAKTGTHLRPGGIMSMVVTHRFLDTANAEARDQLAKDFKFLGAIRLPNDAFRANAGTDVVTDIIFLQKLTEGEKPDLNASWLDTEGKLEGGIRVNRYFAENPSHILGRSAMDGTMYAGGQRGEGEYTVHGDGRDLAKAIDDLLAGSMANLRGTLGTRVEALESAIAQEDTTKMPIGGMMLLPDGRVIRRDDKGIGEVTAETFWLEQAEQWNELASVLRELRDQIKDGGNPNIDTLSRLERAKAIAYTTKGLKPKKINGYQQAVYDVVEGLFGTDRQWRYDAQLKVIEERAESRRLGERGFATLKGLLGLRRKTLELIRAEYQDAPNIEELRADLNSSYDAFVAKHGFIGASKNVSLLQGDIGAELGLEESYSEEVKEDVPGKKTKEVVTPESAVKSKILTRRVNFPHKTDFKADTSEDALLISMSERGVVDLGFMASMLGRDVTELRSELEDKRLIFLDPVSDSYQHADSYLSGNIRAKMNAASAAGLKENVLALRDVMPEPLPKERITPTIRGQWIPTDVFEEFLSDLGVRNPQVSVLSAVGMVSAKSAYQSLTDYGQQFNNPHKDVIDLFNAAANGKSITITEKGPDNKSYKNEEATREVQALIERLGREFQAWAYQDPDRAERIAEAYNEKVNVYRSRTYDGEKYLRPVGLDQTTKKLRRTQKNGAWRIVQDNAVLLDHVVGGGKTLTVAVGVMERRRLGLSKKPMIAVPNHLVMQWAREWLQAYPGARIMAATPKDFEGENRKRMFARIATGDFDAIIIGHSSLGFIETPMDDKQAVIQDQIDELNAVLEEARRNGESKRTLAQIAKRLQKYEEKLEKLLEKAQDDIGIDFAKMGVDYLAVDEAHEFKNLEYSTGQQRLVGMNNPNGSKRAFDLLIKARGLQKRKGAVHFATGTPVSNSLVEVYSMLKYLAYDQLKAMDMAHFDAWSAAFAVAETRFEYTATQKLKERRVLSRLVNLNALSRLYRSFADVIDRNDLERIYAEQVRAENAKTGGNKSERFPTPKVMGGGRRLLSAEATDMQQLATDWFVARMAAIKKNARNKDYPKIDNPLWVLSDARKASLDIRTIAAAATQPRDPNGKVMRSARELKRIYDKWDHVKGAQMVFCDLSTPSKGAEAKATKAIKELAEKVFPEKEVKTRLELLSGKPFTEQWERLIEMAQDVASDPETEEDRADKIEEALALTDEDTALMLVADTGFSVYDDLRAALVEMGVPEKEIAFIHDYDTPAAKVKLFQKVNSGQVRVLIGSTPKMGAGTNAQERLVGLHHIDSPWRPSDVEQREGRIIRAGNLLYEADPEGFEVEILAYSTAGTSDVVLWQVLERKARAIGSFRAGELDEVEEGSEDADSYAEFMAQSTGNPVFRLKMQAEKDMVEQGAVIAGALRSRENARKYVAAFPSSEKTVQGSIALLEAVDPSSVSYTDDRGKTHAGDAAEFDTVLEAERAAAQIERDKWEAKVQLRMQRTAELEKEGKTTSEIRKVLDSEGLWGLGDKPRLPNALSQNVVDQSGWASAVKALLERGKAMYGDGTATMQLKSGARLMLQRQTYAASNSAVFSTQMMLPGGEVIYLANSMAADPTGAFNLIESLSPGYVKEKLERELANRKDRLESLRAGLPEARRVASQEVDTSARDEAAEAVDYYELEVRLAEAQADIDRSKRGFNLFIQSDIRRPLDEMGSEAITTKPKFTYDGVGYTGTGLGAGMFNRQVYEATRDFDGKRVIILASAPEGSDPNPKVLQVVDAPARVAREMQEARENRTKTTQRGASIPDGKIAGVTRAMNAAMKRMGLEGKVTAALVRSINGYTLNTTGTYRAGRIDVSAANGERGAMGVLYHEVVHALRDEALWGKPYGLFTAEEWRSLVAAARGRSDIMARIEDLYADESAQVQAEEAVAELFREWAQRRDAQGVVARALEKVQAFFRALASALRGEGFSDAALVMDRIANGDVGGRGPSGGGGGGGATRTMRAAPPADFRAALRIDNPGGEWLKAKIARVESSAREKGMPKYVKNHIGGATTAWARPLMLPVSELVKLPGANGEKRGPGDYQFDMLAKDVAAMGWDDDQQGNAVLVEVNHKGEAFITEGNTRVALADRLGIQKVKAEIRWLNGGEAKDGPMAPDRVEQIAEIYQPAREFRMPSMPFARDEEAFDKAERGLVSSVLTDAMGGYSRKWNLLGLVPGRALFAELGKDLPSAQRYLRLKEQMDTLRSEWHHTTDVVAQKWRKALTKDRAGNKAMMDLMHDATRAGVDPAMRFVAPRKRPSETAEEHDARVGQLRTAYNELRPRWDALPDVFKSLYVEVRSTYSRLGDAFEKTLIDNVKRAMSINVKRARRAYEAELERIADEGLTGQEKADAIETAKKKLASAERKAEWGINARVTQLRLQFETNKLDGPYFPLMRHGDYFVTIRDEEGKVISFSRFESERKQRAFVKEQQAIAGQSVEYGTMEDGDLREQVDPNFVAEVESILGDKVGDPEVMDMIWQRWLETLPDSSVRRSRIHRKGTPGYDGDAFRAFGKQVFHGGHQLARLAYAMQMKDALEEARLQAQGSSDPNRNGLIVNEMERRNDFTMNPTGSAVAQGLTSAAFIYYLGITPAAAITNLSQTTIVGIPVLAGGFDKMSIGKVSKALMKASGDFFSGRFEAERSPRLTADEKAAMREAYDRGTIDKSEAHDLAGVAESGVEYSDIRMRVMKPISFLFHHTERANREITFLAAYRLARGEGYDHGAAIQKAADLTWKAHFDYQNTSRPRLMQNDVAKVALVFRNFNINMLWRLFRDTHQIFKGKSPEERREARMQLFGITAMMMFHAGVRGTWGYSLLVLLASLIPGAGDTDDVEEELKTAVVETFGAGMGGAILNGIPGHLSGIDLVNRMGMPDLWFRSSDRQLEGDSEYTYFMEQMLGAVPGMAQNVWRGFNQITEDGNMWRGIETAAPKFLRDLMKGQRYLTEGVETYSGDQIIDSVPAVDAFIQAMGFTPAQIAERYEANNRLKNKEKAVLGDRRSILDEVAEAIGKGEGIPPETLERLREFNAEFPSYPITAETIARSVKARLRGDLETKDGIRLNSRLDAPLRLEAAPAIY